MVEQKGMQGRRPRTSPGEHAKSIRQRMTKNTELSTPPEPEKSGGTDLQVLFLTPNEATEMFDEGSTLEAVSCAKDGSDEVDGYYLFVIHPSGRTYVICQLTKPVPKFFGSCDSVLALARRWPIPNVNIPIAPILRNHHELWPYWYHKNGWNYEKDRWSSA